MKTSKDKGQSDQVPQNKVYTWIQNHPGRYGAVVLVLSTFILGLMSSEPLEISLILFMGTMTFLAIGVPMILRKVRRNSQRAITIWASLFFGGFMGGIAYILSKNIEKSFFIFFIISLGSWIPLQYLGREPKSKEVHE